VGDAPPALRRFLWLYALAWAGTAVAYMPLLTLLLPVQVQGLAGRDGSIAWLAWLGLAGAAAASIGHILFGWLSDISRRRRPWAAAGLALSGLLLIAIGQVRTLPALLALIIAWQLALNMMMAPLAALAADHVPDARKGMLGGLLALAPGLGALAGMLVTAPGLGRPLGLALVAGLTMAALLPVLLVPLPPPVEAAKAPPPTGPRTGWPVQRMWLARLGVQIAEATLFAYLYVWFQAVDAAMTANRVASLFAALLLASVPLALAGGRWADRHGRPFRPLAVCALGAAAGLGLMAVAASLGVAIAGFGLFALAAAVFLALHSAQTLRVLANPQRRGRDLGLFNLTNTVPALIMPLLTLGLVPRFGFGGLFVLLALLCGASGLALLWSPDRDDSALPLDLGARS
jgi:MFS family permease